MITVPDAPWIRDAEARGYPTSDEDGNCEVCDCPMLTEEGD